MINQSLFFFFPPTSSTGVKVLLTFRMINVRHYSLKKTKQLGCISKKNEYNIYKFWILNFFFWLYDNDDRKNDRKRFIYPIPIQYILFINLAQKKNKMKLSKAWLLMLILSSISLAKTVWISFFFVINKMYNLFATRKKHKVCKVTIGHSCIFFSFSPQSNLGYKWSSVSFIK